MKKRLFCVLMMTMLLCGCGEEETHQKQKHSSTAATTAAAAAEEATTAPQEAAESVTTAADTAAETTTAAVENTDTETATAADQSAETTDAAYESAGSHVNLDTNDLFAGQFFDENSDLTMVLDNIGNGYKVNISCKVSDTQIDHWYLTGQFDGRAVLHYNNCSKYIVTLDENGMTSSTETVYTNGTGYIAISERGADDTGYVWSDDVDNAGSGAFFKK